MKEVVRKLPGVVTAAKVARLLRDVRTYRSFPFLTFAAPGHFYSPIPSASDITPDAATFDATRASVSELKDVPIRAQAQLELLSSFSIFTNKIPFTATATDDRRYGFDNSFFSYGDGAALYCFLRHFLPKRVIEIGSGYSSALMLDTRSAVDELDFELISIEPYPERLLSLIRPEDESAFTLHQKFAQDVPTEVFEQLEANDILFVDSSHIGKVNSDLLDILFRVLPHLKPGVLIHFHDIPWPFEYPAHWFEEGRAWNEAYMLRALLQGSDQFEIVFFNDYLRIHHAASLQAQLPVMLESSSAEGNLSCSSLWIQKRR